MGWLIPQEYGQYNGKVIEVGFLNATTRRQDAETEHTKATQAFDKATLIFRKTLDREIDKQKAVIEDAQSRVKEANGNTHKAESWLNDHKADAGLADQLTDLAADLTELKTTRKALSQEWDNLREIAAELSEETVAALPESVEDVVGEELEGIISDFSGKLERAYNDAEKQCRTAEKDLTLRVDHLSKARLVAQFEDHRASLVSGEACPLCGSTEHPYAESHEPSFPFAELEKEVSTARTALDDGKKRVETFQRAGKDLEDIHSRITELLSEWTALRFRLISILTAFNLDLPSAGEEDATRKALQKRAKNYQKHLEARDEAAEIEQKARQDEAQANSRLDELIPKLEPLGDQELDDLEETDDASALPSLKQAEGDWGDGKSELGIKYAALKDRKYEEKQAARKLDQVQEHLVGKLEGSEFVDLNDLLEAKLEQAEADRIEGILKDLEERESGLKTRLVLAQHHSSLSRIPGGTGHLTRTGRGIGRSGFCSSTTRRATNSGCSWTPTTTPATERAPCMWTPRRRLVGEVVV